MNFKSVIIAAMMVSSGAFAAHDDVRTEPDRYFLSFSDVADSIKLLPPPPEVGSVIFLNDEAQYRRGYQLRNTERGRRAAEDANIFDGKVAQVLSEAFGMEISEDNTPEIQKIIKKMSSDAADLATRAAKLHYRRLRPFAYYGEKTCDTLDVSKISKNTSYPSGHTSLGWAAALILAEINPARQNEILKRGFEIGQSRVICGYHWQSDVDAARLLASALVARLHADSDFVRQLDKAKAEFAEKSGKTQ